jgi:hypothetical protein
VVPIACRKHKSDGDQETSPVAYDHFFSVALARLHEDARECGSVLAGTPHPAAANDGAARNRPPIKLIPTAITADRKKPMFAADWATRKPEPDGCCTDSPGNQTSTLRAQRRVRQN